MKLRRLHISLLVVLALLCVLDVRVAFAYQPCPGGWTQCPASNPCCSQNMDTMVWECVPISMGCSGCTCPGWTTGPCPSGWPTSAADCENYTWPPGQTPQWCQQSSCSCPCGNAYGV